MADSPVTPVQIKAVLADSTSSVCGNMIATLLKFPILIYQILEAWLDADGNFTDAFKVSISKITVKPGDLILSAAPLNTDGRLLCDGSTVSRTAYANLFAAIGVLYGAGDGSSTFQLPNYRDKFPVGAGNAYDLATSGGEATHLLTAAEAGSDVDHKHVFGRMLFPTGENDDAAFATGTETDGALTAETVQGAAGSGGGGSGPLSGASGSYLVTGKRKGADVTFTAHNNLPPYVACYIYIKT